MTVQTATRPAKPPRTARKNRMVADVALSDRRQGRLICWFLAEQERRKTQPATAFGTAVTELLFDLIRGEAYRAALRRNFGDRDTFAASIPADILYPLRKKVLTRPIELYRQDRPFLPWLRRVLGNFLNSAATGRRQHITDAELLAALPDETNPDEVGEWPARSFSPEFCERLESATTLQRLIVFLAMTGLYQNHPDWPGLLARYADEPLKPKQKTRQPLSPSFPSMAVDKFATPRTRTRPLATEIGLKANTVSKTFERARADLAELFPDAAMKYRADTLDTPDDNGGHS